MTRDGAAGIAAGDFLHAYRIRRPDVILHSPVYFPALMGGLEREPWFRREVTPPSRRWTADAAIR